MDIAMLEALYRKLLLPVFGDCLRIIHERDDFVHVILDGGREDFFFTLYGTDHVRLYWCGQCFIFDGRRNELVSSDTYGEIVFEGPIDVRGLPERIAELVLQLKDCSYVDKEEETIGKIPSGYDDIKNYVIRARTPVSRKPAYQLGNIRIVYDAD